MNYVNHYTGTFTKFLLTLTSPEMAKNMNTQYFDFCGFRNFIMNDVCNYLISFKSDIYLDIAQFSRIRSNKVLWLFVRETGTHVARNKKEFNLFASYNQRCYKLDFICDKTRPMYARIETVKVTEVDITNITKI